jgi:uncharacterized protein (DUF302 family)
MLAIARYHATLIRRNFMAPLILTRRGLFSAGLGLAAATGSASFPAGSSAHAETAPGGSQTADSTQTRTVAVEHIRLVCRKKFDEVHSALVKNLPQLDPALASLLVGAKTEEIAAQRANGPKLWLFLARDHGSLLAAEGRIAKAKHYEIGNPLTAERMTRYQLSAALYAPLRVVLYEDEHGRAIFEYDRPSSLFGQYGDERVTQVGRELDQELERALLDAAG